MPGRVPPWLEPLLTTPFFSACRTHGDAARSERNMFCLDCAPAADAFCFYCRSSKHNDHQVIQVNTFPLHIYICVFTILPSTLLGSSFYFMILCFFIFIFWGLDCDD